MTKPSATLTDVHVWADDYTGIVHVVFTMSDATQARVFGVPFVKPGEDNPDGYADYATAKLMAENVAYVARLAAKLNR